MRKLVRKIIYSITYLKAKLLNPKIKIGKNCRIEWNAKFRGMNPIVIGNNCDIRNGAILMPHCGYIKIGNYAVVGAYNILDGSGGLEIGNQVRLGPHICMHSANHNFNNLDSPIYTQGLTLKKIIIEDNVWIGAHATILAGVTIEEGAIVAAGSVVTKDVLKNSIVAGNPAKFLKSRI